MRRRLKNLGYHRPVPGQTSVDASAILAFQRDHGLEPTGVLDDAMKNKLKEIHGE